MRDHLFHAEEEETSFRVFREERQIRYTISPVNNRVSFHFRHVFLQHTHYPLEETKQTTEEVPSSLPENQPPQSEENSLPVAKVNRTGDELLLKQIKTIRDTVRMDQDLLHLGSNQALKNLPQLIQQVQKNKNPLLISEVGFVFAFSFPASQSLHHHV